MKKMLLLLMICSVTSHHSQAQAEIIAVIKAGIVLVINEVKNGKLIHFNPEENKLFIAASEYRKVP